MTAPGNPFEDLDTSQLANGMYVWVWNSPGGAFHQGPRHYKRRADALRAGKDWLTELLSEAMGASHGPASNPHAPNTAEGGT